MLRFLLFFCLKRLRNTFATSVAYLGYIVFPRNGDEREMYHMYSYDLLDPPVEGEAFAIAGAEVGGEGEVVYRMRDLLILPSTTCCKICIPFQKR